MSSEVQSKEKKQPFFVRWTERIWNVKHYHIYFDDEASYNNGATSISHFTNNNNIAIYYTAGYSCSGNRLKKLPSGDFKPDIPKFFIYILFLIFILRLLIIFLDFIIMLMLSFDISSKIHYITTEMLGNLLHYLSCVLLLYFLCLIIDYFRARKASSSGKAIVLSIIMRHRLEMVEFLKKEKYNYEIYSI